MLPKTVPKSILKKTKSKPPATPSEHVPPEKATSSDPVKDRHLATALHHAKLIQQQKDTEKLILDASLALLELPSSPNADAAMPAAHDVRAFKEHVALLRPQDYSDLIEERNASRLCGYALCPRPNKELKGDAKFKLVVSKEAGLKSIPKKELERWCSTDCARRALYVKVQLLEEPGGILLSGRSADIDLLAEDIPSTLITLPLRPKVMDSCTHSHKNDTEAASTRHDIHKDVDNASSELLTSRVVEKRVIKAVSAPSLEHDGQNHSVIEGYTPADRFLDKQEQGTEEDHDWDD
ncbi:hypothetical protein EJ05DRAFT_27868 [Pseudovirgaria hyperparasitica]|uniref:RNA polymerase II subunit B1 CTD phosphatase RPAP2 homolog n=1 Tax=Pseudovirgaria hyperparasitica TaxID=470096 RepID=A0A6A6WLY0_9PEZI|nr:uncharacterized protein EJ05DRAFT_27868 [Pseudovirgaria hyperparasitica]KAF2763156.1 hypothetical protein EJ05DRAFT_27868 [Pseudovirgaria hyperparasitica]